MTSVLEEGLREQMRKARGESIARVARGSMKAKKRPGFWARVWATLKRGF